MKNNNSDVTPRVVCGYAVPRGATVAHQIADGREVDVMEDPAAVLASDELVAVLAEPEPRPWPSAPLIRVWEGSDDGEPIPPGTLMVRDDVAGAYKGFANGFAFWVFHSFSGDSLSRWEDVEGVPTSMLAGLSSALDRWGGDDSEPGHALASIVRALSGNAGGEAA